MQIYEVRISHGARADMAELRKFLKSMMTVEGAIRYANNMREEIKTLAFYYDTYLSLVMFWMMIEENISSLGDSNKGLWLDSTRKNKINLKCN